MDKWNGMEWNGMEWNGMEWNGMEWNGRVVTSKRTARARAQADTMQALAAQP